MCNNWAWLWPRPLAVSPLLAWPKYVYIDPVYETALFSLDCIWNNVVKNVASGGDRVTDVALMSLAWQTPVMAPNGMKLQSDKRSEVVGDIVNKRSLIVWPQRLWHLKYFPSGSQLKLKNRGVWSHKTTHMTAVTWINACCNVLKLHVTSSKLSRGFAFQLFSTSSITAAVLRWVKDHSRQKLTNQS